MATGSNPGTYKISLQRWLSALDQNETVQQDGKEISLAVEELTDGPHADRLHAKPFAWVGQGTSVPGETYEIPTSAQEAAYSLAE